VRPARDLDDNAVSSVLHKSVHVNEHDSWRTTGKIVPWSSRCTRGLLSRSTDFRIG
jgi:hypothetical protein